MDLIATHDHEVCNLQDIWPLPSHVMSASWPTSNRFSHHLQCTLRKHAAQQLQLMSFWLLLHAIVGVHGMHLHGSMSIPISCHRFTIQSSQGFICFRLLITPLPSSAGDLSDHMHSLGQTDPSKGTPSVRMQLTTSSQTTGRSLTSGSFGRRRHLLGHTFGQNYQVLNFILAVLLHRCRRP